MSEISNYRDFDPTVFAELRTAVIDGDGFAYAVGWNHKDDTFEDKARKEVDDIMHDILQGVRAGHYIGILRPSHEYELQDDPENPLQQIEVRTSKANFRVDIAKSAVYKGTRSAKPEWYYQWQPVIEDQLIAKWGFVRTPETFEADDLVVTMYNVISAGGGKAIICGNDKDLRQQPGEHFNLRKKILDVVTKEEGSLNLWRQVLMGDSTDGIPGIKGMGPKTADKVLLGSTEPYELIALQTYIESCNGDVDAGIKCFYENYMLVKLCTTVSLDQFEEEEIIHGYDLKAFEDYNKINMPDESEDVPDFG